MLPFFVSLLVLLHTRNALGQEAQEPDMESIAWSRVGAHFELVDISVPTGNATYARAPDTLIGGDVLAHGQQPSFEACAASCSAVANCSGFNFCDQGPCPANVDGDTFATNTCQLVYQQRAADGRGILELASGNYKLGDAGVKVLVKEPPESDVPPDWRLYFSQSLQDVYDILCNGSFNPDSCVLPLQSQEAISFCEEWPECQAVQIGFQWGSWRVPYAMFKGSGTGEPIDPMKGNLNPATYLLVKKDQLLEALLPAQGSAPPIASDEKPPQQDSGGGLSAGAIAGIAIGSAVLALLLVLALFVMWRRKHSRQTQQQDLADALKPEGVAAALDVAATWDKMEDGSPDSSQQLLAGLLSETPNPQWSDVVIPHSRIKFVTANGKAVKLGGGASGTVFRGLLNGVTPCALKVFDFQTNASLPKFFMQEAFMLRRLSHPNILQFLGVSVVEGQGVLVMELAERGDLYKALRADANRAGGRLYSWNNRGCQVALEVASALQYIHEKSSLHMDLKSSNALLTKAGSCKVGDLGFSRMLSSSHVSSLQGRIGTFAWCAPEVLLGGRASQASDVYSYGILLWELCTGEEPVRGYMEGLQVPEQCPAEIAALQARCVRLDPAERPSSAEIVQELRMAMSKARRASSPGPAAGAVGQAGSTSPPLSPARTAPTAASGSEVVGPSSSAEGQEGDCGVRPRSLTPAGSRTSLQNSSGEEQQIREQLAQAGRGTGSACAKSPAPSSPTAVVQQPENGSRNTSQSGAASLGSRGPSAEVAQQSVEAQGQVVLGRPSAQHVDWSKKVRLEDGRLKTPASPFGDWAMPSPEKQYPAWAELETKSTPRAIHDTS